VICSKLEAYAWRQINNYRPRDKGETMRAQPTSAFGGKADIGLSPRNVRFCPKAGIDFTRGKADMP